MNASIDFKPTPPVRAFSSLVACLAAMLVVGAVPCAAQQGRFGVGYQNNMSRFIPPPRSINQQLKDAEEAIAEQRYSDAIVALGDLLERNLDPNDDLSIAGQDFFLDITDSDQQRLDESFLRRCRRLIGELPAEAHEIYEARYGALAKQLLETATASRDWQQLREVRRKYFHTGAGYQASLILAQRELHLGHPLAASLLLDAVVASKNAISELGQEVRVMHAVACRLSGRSLPRELATLEIRAKVRTEGRRNRDHRLARLDRRPLPDSSIRFGQPITRLSSSGCHRLSQRHHRRATAFVHAALDARDDCYAAGRTEAPRQDRRAGDERPTRTAELDATFGSATSC